MNFKKYFTIQFVKNLARVAYHDFVRNIVKDLVNDDDEDWDEKFLESLDKLVEKLTRTKRFKKGE